ncbi:hypothetical protein J4226_00925 [Candidatus Pacearchaeota archaeon]|nr:hypothetical protein [Candidatus Pacearchaeota archaeon]
MALESVMGDLNDLISVLPVEVLDKILNLIFVLKTLGVIAIVYFLYAIVIKIFTYRKMKKIDLIEERVEAIDKKLNRLLKKK